MCCQHDRCQNRNRHGVPVEQADMTADVEVREKRHCEITLGIKWNAARDVTCSRAEKDREEKIGKDEIKIPIRLPKPVVDVAANLDGNSPQNQAPQNQKECEIVAGESRCHQAREDRDQCSTETKEPYLMPRP